jgi:hypothetical protein
VQEQQVRAVVDGTSLGLPPLLAFAQQNPGFFTQPNVNVGSPSTSTGGAGLSAAALLQALAPLAVAQPPASHAFFVASSLFSSPTAASIANAQAAAAAAAAAASPASEAQRKQLVSSSSSSSGAGAAALAANTWLVTPSIAAARYAVSASTTSFTSSSPPVVWAGPLQAAIRVPPRSTRTVAFATVPLTTGFVHVPFVLAWSVSQQQALTHPRDVPPLFVHPPEISFSAD